MLRPNPGRRKRRIRAFNIRVGIRKGGGRGSHDQKKGGGKKISHSKFITKKGGEEEGKEETQDFLISTTLLNF